MKFRGSRRQLVLRRRGKLQWIEGFTNVLEIRLFSADERHDGRRVGVVADRVVGVAVKIQVREEDLHECELKSR